jgi:hypothetical protein
MDMLTRCCLSQLEGSLDSLDYFQMMPKPSWGNGNNYALTKDLRKATPTYHGVFLTYSIRKTLTF